eukprot:3875995-Prymnesium_polylepis.1
MDGVHAILVLDNERGKRLANDRNDDGCRARALVLGRHEHVGGNVVASQLATVHTVGVYTG